MFENVNVNHEMITDRFILEYLIKTQKSIQNHFKQLQWSFWQQ